VGNTPQIHDVLYACFTEVASAGDRLCALEILKAFLEQLSQDANPSINTPLLLRCAVRLLYMPASDGQQEFSEQYGELQLAQDTCHFFEIGISQLTLHMVLMLTLQP
jgi:hypothetical protein